MPIVPLDTLVPGEKGTIQSIATPAAPLRQRLMEMGLTKGAHVELIRLAPLGDPIEILIRGYRLSLRKEEAGSVQIEKDEQ
ncbi:MAG TPA: FeoA family protein [Bacteroidota bacterium]|nr:FeoA family protein [Bacteroidota bacterium]